MEARFSMALDWSRIDDRRRQNALGPLAMELSCFFIRRREKALGPLAR
jgi:hypothetical protein